MPARKVDPDELRRLHGQGWHRDELAAHFGVAPAVVTRYRRELGLALEAPRRSPEAGARKKVDRDEFRRLDAEGRTLKELADHFGVDRVTASRIRKELGLTREHFLTPERKARIEERIEDGWPFNEIARTERVDVETLRRHWPGRAWSVAQAGVFNAEVRNLHKDLFRAAYSLSARDLRKSSFVA